MVFYIATFLIVAGVALYVAAPLTSSLIEHRRSKTSEQQSIEHWQHEQALAVQGLRELEFDRQMGKLADADYESLRASLENKALEAMTALEKINDGIRQRRLAALDTPKVRPQEPIEDRPNAATQPVTPASAGQPTSPEALKPQPPPPSPIAEPRRNASVGADHKTNGRRLRFCPQCGLRVSTTSNFCGECGAPLRAGERTAARSS